MRSDRERLLDIKEAIERIERYAVQGRSAFDRDELIQNWIVHHLLLIGEAAAALSSEFRGQHAEVTWAQIVGMRNILVHRYFDVDADVVWAVVERDLMPLKAFVDTTLRAGSI